MKSRIASRRDLEFQLFEVLDAEALAARPRFAEHSRETFLSALDTAFDVADAKFAPHNRAVDEHEPTFEGGRVRLLPEAKEALRAFVDASSRPAAGSSGGSCPPSAPCSRRSRRSTPPAWK